MLNGEKIDRAKNSKVGFKVFKTMMSTVVCKPDFYYTNIKTTYIASRMNALLVPTDFRFEPGFVTLVRLSRYNTKKA